MQIVYKSLTLLLAVFSAIGLLALASSTTLLSPSYLAMATVALIMLSSFTPDFSIVLFLFLLPVFGNKPGTNQAHYLLILGMALQIGLSLAAFRKKSNQDSRLSLAPAFWYLIISALSLFPVSFRIFWEWLRSSQSSFSNLALLKWNLSSILLSREDDPSYPLLSVFWTALAFSLSYFIYIFAGHRKNSRNKYCWALFSGFLCSLIFGLLNYYGFINIAGLRELDPVVNPGGTQYRLQSWFGHSGWYAEYVTMLAPFAMLILTLTIPYWTRVSVLLFLLLVGEIVLILTFQRGGWLSYPLTLLAVWTSIYVLKRLDKGDSNILHAFKGSALKILISLPLTLLISFLVLKTFGSQFGLDQYADRFKDIAKTSDRSDFIKAGFELGALNPILGQGSESFALQYRREFRKEDGAYFAQIDLPLHGTAHNLYAQTFAGKGLLGLAGLLLIIFMGVRRGIRYVLSPESIRSRTDQIISLIGICSLLACFIYGFVQELFYVQSLQYVFFAIFGILASLPLTSESQNSNRKNKNIIIASAILVLFCAHIFWAIHKGRPYSDAGGCFNEESNHSEETWRWCGLRSSIDLPAKELENKIITIETAPKQKDQPEAQLLTVKSCDQILFSEVVKPSQRVSFLVKPDSLLCKNTNHDLIRINAYYGNYFIPAQQSADSSDRRVLALRWIFKK